jgi:hypothetical protein
MKIWRSRCETWVPLGPTDQAHGRPRQMGPTYQKTRRPDSRPNRPSWRPTRPPKDLQASPNDLIHNDFKTWRARQDIGGFRPSRSKDIATRLRSRDWACSPMVGRSSGTLPTRVQILVLAPFLGFSRIYQRYTLSGKRHSRRRWGTNGDFGNLQICWCSVIRRFS